MKNFDPKQEELPAYDNPFIFKIQHEDENGSYDADEEQRRFEEEEEHWLIDQEF